MNPIEILNKISKLHSGILKVDLLETERQVLKLLEEHGFGAFIEDDYGDLEWKSSE